MRLTNLTRRRDVTTNMRPTPLRRCSDVLACTLMSLNHRRCRKNVLPSTQKKLTHFTDQFECPRLCWGIITTSQLLCQYNRPIWDVFATSHSYVNKTDQSETSKRYTSCYLTETDQHNTSQRCFNWYLNETDVFETL